jgi:hypothetical protein
LAGLAQRLSDAIGDPRTGGERLGEVQSCQVGLGVEACERARDLPERHSDWIATGDRRLPFPMFGFEVGKGWAGLLTKLFDEAAAIVRPTGEKLVIGQIKEKFGTLRFYWSGRFDRETSDCIDEAVDLAEFRSGATCEECGARGSMWNAHGWYAVRCDDHAGRGVRDIGGRIGRISGSHSEGEYWRVFCDPDAEVVARERLTREQYEHLTRRQDDD